MLLIAVLGSRQESQDSWTLIGGDGTKDQYPLVKVSDGSYRIVFRSLDIEYKKNPDDTVWWYKKEDGSQYIPVPHISIAISGVGRLR